MTGSGTRDEPEAGPTPGAVVRVAVPVPLHRLFDYLAPPGQPPPAPGSRVRVPFGRRELIGIVVESKPQSRLASERLKPIAQILDPSLVPAELLALLRWTTRYYAAPPGELAGHGLPTALRRGRAPASAGPDWLRLADDLGPEALTRAPRQREVAALLADGPRARSDLLSAGADPATLARMLRHGRLQPCAAALPEALPGPTLHPEQRRAAAAILAARRRFEVLLLAGVTGSGKTEVYLHCARHVLAAGRQVLVLVPEIGLTPQFVRRIETRLGERAHVYHSGLADGARLDTWHAAREGRARLLIGTRSAVFLPLSRPGMFVIDEEHDSSFKQFDGLRYHARDVAVYRASRLGIPVVLGSATPSLESLANAQRGRYRQLQLQQRATGSAMPNWRVVDSRRRPAGDGLTDDLIESIGATLGQGRQVLIYRNRRGYAPVVMCNECGWQADCSHCSAHLTWHRAAHRLICHHCGRTRRMPERCPDCGSPRMEALGAGTERIEQALKARFPDVEVLRIDRDAVRGHAEFEEVLTRVAEGRPCILVGTRMLAKGHHLPGIGLAAVLDADARLFSADFRAAERLAQDLVQVAGRAGRTSAGQFMLLSRHGDHPLVRALAHGDYPAAAEILLAERRAAGLPPYAHLAMIRAEARSEDTARRFLHRVRQLIHGGPDVEVSGPFEAILQRRAGYWRQQLWLSARERAPLLHLLGPLPARVEKLDAPRDLRWHVDVDPLEM